MTAKTNESGSSRCEAEPLPVGDGVQGLLYLPGTIRYTNILHYFAAEYPESEAYTWCVLCHRKFMLGERLELTVIITTTKGGIGIGLCHRECPRNSTADGSKNRTWVTVVDPTQNEPAKVSL